MTRLPTYALATLAGLAAATPAWASFEFSTIQAEECTQYVACYANSHVAKGAASAATQYGTANALTFFGGVANAAIDYATIPFAKAGDISEHLGATLQYTFQIQGPSNAVVPLHVYGAVDVSPIRATTANGQLLTIDATGTPSDFSSFIIASTAFFSVTGVVANGSVGSISTGVSNNLNQSRLSPPTDIAGERSILDKIFFLRANSDIKVELSAAARLSFNFNGSEVASGSVSASADPTFTIDDPAFSAFRVVGVPGGGTVVAAVPEPSTWAMMMLGFAGIGVMTYRRRTNAAAVAA